MLKLLRNKKLAKKIWITLAILVLPAFLFWGLGSTMGSKKESAYVGEIFGKKISNSDYKEAQDAVKNMGLMRFGENFFNEEKLNINAQAWGRLILLEEAKRRKIKTSDREVVMLIESYPFFQKKGVFDSKIYAETLRYVFHTQARTFEEQTRDNLIIAKLYTQVTSNINITEDELRKAYLKEHNMAEKNIKNIDEKKFSAEKDFLSRKVLLQKRDEVFAKFLSDLSDKAKIK